MLPLGIILPHTCSPMGAWLCWLCGNLGRENCPRDWEWRPELQKCYYIIEEKSTWDDANAKCGNLSANASLTSIGSEKENNYIASLVHIINDAAGGGHHYPWVGGKFTATRELYWVDGSSVTFKNYFGAEPDRDGYCLSLDVVENDHGGPALWGDHDCALKAPIICSKRARLIPPTPPTNCKSLYLVPQIFNANILMKGGSVNLTF